jgi:excisionase family DNA binding protein
MTNLIGKKVSEENEIARAVFVGQDSALSGRFLKPEEFAEYLGIPLRWIYRHIKDIPHHRVGKYLRFDPESPALRHWIQSLERRPQH